MGKAGNQARQAIEAAIEERTAALEAGELDARLAADAIDVTLPGDPPLAPGRLNLITATRREIEDIFLGLGFTVAEGPEVELVYYNFDALNHNPQHPARQPSDTFYVSDPTRCSSPTPSSCACTHRPCRCARWSCSRHRCTSSCPAASLLLDQIYDVQRPNVPEQYATVK